MTAASSMRTPTAARARLRQVPGTGLLARYAGTLVDRVRSVLAAPGAAGGDAPVDAVDAVAVPELPVDAAGPDWPVLVGVSCRDGHLNDPGVLYCALCGISMMQAAGIPVVDRRPALGVLVLDDGTAFPLDRDYVLGHAPEDDPAVAAGLAGALRVADASLSAVHARVLLDGWTIALAAAGSVAGTYVCAPGQQSWSPLPAGRPVALTPGSRVAVGSRQLRYDSYRNP